MKFKRTDLRIGRFLGKLIGVPNCSLYLYPNKKFGYAWSDDKGNGFRIRRFVPIPPLRPNRFNSGNGSQSAQPVAA